MILARKDYTRLEAFSDAIIAFACVRLILSLDVPKGYADVVKNVTGFIPFAVTFGALLLIWVAHRNLFRRYPLDDGFTLVVNGLFLFTIVFYAFPLKFIAGDGSGAVTADVYHIRDRVQRKLLSENEGEINLGHLPQMRQMIETLFSQVLSEENLLYTRAVRARLLEIASQALLRLQ